MSNKFVVTEPQGLSEVQKQLLFVNNTCDRLYAQLKEEPKDGRPAMIQFELEQMSKIGTTLSRVIALSQILKGFEV